MVRLLVWPLAIVKKKTLSIQTVLLVPSFNQVARFNEVKIVDVDSLHSTIDILV